MREKLWKKIEKVIANDNEYSLRSAGTTAIDDEYGFEILLKKNSGFVELPEPMSEKKVKREPLRCKFGFHKWSKWGLPHTNYGLAQFQDRRCVLCNKFEEVAL